MTLNTNFNSDSGKIQCDEHERQNYEIKPRKYSHFSFPCLNSTKGYVVWLRFHRISLYCTTISLLCAKQDLCLKAIVHTEPPSWGVIVLQQWAHRMGQQISARLHFTLRHRKYFEFFLFIRTHVTDSCLRIENKTGEWCNPQIDSMLFHMGFRWISDEKYQNGFFNITEVLKK